MHTGGFERSVNITDNNISMIKTKTEGTRVI